MADGAGGRVGAAERVAGRGRVGAEEGIAGGLAQARVAGRVAVCIARIHGGLVLRIEAFVLLVRWLNVEGGGVAGVLNAPRCRSPAALRRAARGRPLAALAAA